MLQTKDISKSFEGVHAVDRVSMEFAPGAITSIVGPNGSGKSTFINLLTGMIPFDAGVVYVGESVELSRVRPYDISAYGITRTFQDVRLFEQMTVLENILVVLTARGVVSAFFERHGEYHRETAEEVLKKVGLRAKKDESAANLSYGQRKLLEIARVLAMAKTHSHGNASVFFFDEPFAGLFREMSKVVVEILKELRAHGKTVILVEHNMELIRELSDHLYVMDSGEVLAEGKPSEVLAKKEVIEAYLGE